MHSSSLIVIAGTAAFVGLIHSLSPGHWFPIVLVSKTRRWPISKTVLGASVAAFGHVLISSVIAVIALALELRFLPHKEEVFEKYAALAMVVFGLIYALVSYFNHHDCHGHEHHGPHPPEGRNADRKAWIFLFSVGFSPCVAALPMFFAALGFGVSGVVFTLIAFALGVFTSLVGSSVLARKGLAKLDLPLLEHHGDKITGVMVALVGMILYFL